MPNKEKRSQMRKIYRAETMAYKLELIAEMESRGYDIIAPAEEDCRWFTFGTGDNVFTYEYLDGSMSIPYVPMKGHGSGGVWEHWYGGSSSKHSEGFIEFLDKYKDASMVPLPKDVFRGVYVRNQARPIRYKGMKDYRAQVPIRWALIKTKKVGE